VDRIDDGRNLATVLVLAIDTATPAVTAGVVQLESDGIPRTLAQRVTVNAKAHGELLVPHVMDALHEVGRTLANLNAIVCGSGPGPFTGLRVGMVTAAAFGHALGLPVYPVVSLDAIAADARAEAGLLVATDARRREVYWATYDAAGHRTGGPGVRRPAELVSTVSDMDVTTAAGEGAESYADVVGLPVSSVRYPSPSGLVAVAAGALLAGAEPGPLTPLYLRRPDAVEPVGRKRVSQP